MQYTTSSTKIIVITNFRLGRKCCASTSSLTLKTIRRSSQASTCWWSSSATTSDPWHVTRDTWRDWHVDTDYRELTLYHNITLLVMHHLLENSYGWNLFGFILTYYIFLISQKQCVQIWIVCLSKSLMWSFYKSVPDPNMYWLPSTFLILASNTINYTLSTYFWLHWDM